MVYSNNDKLSENACQDGKPQKRTGEVFLHTIRHSGRRSFNFVKDHAICVIFNITPIAPIRIPIFTETPLVNPGKLKKILLFSILAALSALLWYGNSHWRISDRIHPLEEADLTEEVDTFPVERSVSFDITHARMLLLSGLQWKISTHNREVLFNGTLEELRSKRIALPAPGPYGYNLNIEGMDRSGKQLYWWCSDNAYDLRESGVNIIHLLYTGDPYESTAFKIDWAR
jgi:hypothetical protein